MGSVVNMANGNLELLDTVGGGQNRSIAQLKQAGVDKYDLIVIILSTKISGENYLYSSMLHKSFLLNIDTTINNQISDFTNSHKLVFNKDSQLWNFGMSNGYTGNYYIYGLNL